MSNDLFFLNANRSLVKVKVINFPFSSKFLLNCIVTENAGGFSYGDRIIANRSRIYRESIAKKRTPIYSLASEADINNHIEMDVNNAIADK